MAKIVRKRRKKKKIVLTHFAAFMFVVSSLSYLGSSLFLRTYNNSLSSRKQEIDSQIAELETQNDAVRVVIQTLSARDRVDSIASENGLTLDQDNIITITAANDSGE
ncbi:MAG: hypothetical protein IKE06_00695 [Solobacterium sp.]|nr:hypothetical protein [Solobacterium sp.]